MTSQVAVYEMFIPYMYRGKSEEATEKRVFWVFKQLNWGYISKVSIMGYKEESKTVMARISYTRMNSTETVESVLKVLNDGGAVQVNYEEGKPWFWNVVKYVERERKVSYKIKPEVNKKVDFKPTVVIPKLKRQEEIKIEPRPSTPDTRPSTPDTRPSTPDTRPSTPDTRPSTPEYRPMTPEAPPSTSESVVKTPDFKPIAVIPKAPKKITKRKENTL
jgi:hypothetical protein